MTDLDVSTPKIKINPLLPADYCRMTPQKKAETITGIQAYIQTRRTWIELKRGIAREEGKIKQFLADLEEIGEALALNKDRRGKPLKGHRRRHMEGRADILEAEVTRSFEMIEQYQMEIDFYIALMQDGKECAA